MTAPHRHQCEVDWCTNKGGLADNADHDWLHYTPATGRAQVRRAGGEIENVVTVGVGLEVDGTGAATGVPRDMAELVVHLYGDSGSTDVSACLSIQEAIELTADLQLAVARARRYNSVVAG
ncbi:hypothetical protein [Rhodococcus sp. MEB064]|uniref:hypothetical protein n=1 Tax=Rhodococcus sp. MEB064 TaxID=1587522 RepID=UPI0005AC0229|nr:hypothetical protein [Rhodococcus sp. MEB064]KIQ15324.1 hypothetical protein RU01_15395 [Rhodococcus sp. MEB064]